ncbi:MAG: trehalase family glycosidase [Armatimonadota bacterium]|nr:hypothetical protein [bacterium]
MPISRDPFVFGQHCTTVDCDWKKLLKNNEQSFITDNQLSTFVSNNKPGCDRIHFYPLPFPYTFSGDKWNYEELINHNSLISEGPALDFQPDEAHLVFQPHLIEKKLVSADATINEKCAVSGNTLIICWDMHRLSKTRMSFSLPYFNANVEKIDGGIVASVKGSVFCALSVAGAEDVEFETQREPFSCSVDIRGSRVHLAITCGYDKSLVTEENKAALADPGAVFDAAEKMWNDYFTKIVPHFSCSDKTIEQLYYYQAYMTRANLYDIPYEPFTRPYTCPWKTGALWQWSWNTPMNSVCERWLNDKSIGAGGILMEGDNGGALNIGSFLRPLKKIDQLRVHNAFHQALGEYLKKLPDEYDMALFTTMPHSTPNGLLGAWELYLASGDKDYLRDALAIMLEAESLFSRDKLENGLYTTSFVDEYDYSLRLKPFIKAFAKGDTAMMLKMDTPFAAIDYNCYLHSLRERIIQAAAVLGESSVDVELIKAKNIKLKAAINEYLWDDEDGFYYDADPRDMSRSKVKCIAAFSALYAGIASPEQAKRMVKHLTNPLEFGTPYPCPSISIDTPEVDPSLLTYGGDCSITSGIYFTAEGLIKYGYTDLASQYILKTIKMVMRDGPSSSYSYHCITGDCNQEKHTLAAQSGIITDMICKNIIGIHPQANGMIDANPIALATSGIESFTFGPYRYQDKVITVSLVNGKYQVFDEVVTS